MSNCSVKYCQKMPTKVNGLTEVSAKGYLLIHKFLVHVKLKYCEWNKIIVRKLDSLCCVINVVFYYRNCPFPFHGRFFLGGGVGLRHLPSLNPLRDFKTLYFETSTHLQISENIPWWRYGYFLEQHKYIFNWGLQ